MFSSWAKAFKNRDVRIWLGIYGTLVSVFFGPSCLIGMYWLIGSFFSTASDRFIVIGWSLIGTFGLFGIVAAWVMVIKHEKLEKSIIFRSLILVGLSLGILACLAMTVVLLVVPENPAGWFMLITLLVGVFLFGATIGFRNSTIESYDNNTSQ